MPTPTELFVYGTLRHDQSEHRKYCRGVTGWKRARIRGRLFFIPEGYRLIVVPPTAVLFDATPDALADEHRRAVLGTVALVDASRVDVGDSAWTWIDGELLAFSDATLAWPPLDAWENYAPGKPGIYPRRVVPVDVEGAGPTAAWAYVATEAPPGSQAV